LYTRQNWGMLVGTAGNQPTRNRKRKERERERERERLISN